MLCFLIHFFLNIANLYNVLINFYYLIIVILFQLTLECSFQDDLGLDSLDVVELVMALEDEFGKM